MSKKTHRKYSSSFKVQLLKEHLINKISVAQLCDQHGVKPSLFYLWQKELFEQGQLIFEKPKGRKKETSKQEEKIQSLEEKLTRKNEVLSELMEEHVALKKQFGES